MKRIVPFALLALLLCACDAAPAPTEATEAVQPATEATQPPTLPSETRDSVTTFALDGGNCAGILRWNETSYALLTTSGQMSLLSGRDLRIDNSRDLGCQLTSDDPSILVNEDQISYYDTTRGAYVTLGKNLTEISAISIRDAITAGPIMSGDFSTIYYCTAQGVRALDMATGTSRMLRQEHGTIISLDGILFDGAILRYTRQAEGVNESCFIRTDDGSQVYFAQLDGQLTTWGKNYAAVMNLAFPMGQFRQILTGSVSGGIQDLKISGGWDSVLFPGEATALVQTVTEEGLRLELYDLTKGTLSASRVFDDHEQPFPHAWNDGGNLWLWNEEERLLHRWTLGQDAQSSGSFFAYHYTLSDPDREGLNECAELAKTMTQTYGISISIEEDSNRTTGVDYSGYPDYRPEQYRQALELLEQTLDRFPETMLRRLGADGKLQLRLVDDYDPAITGYSGTGSLEFGSPRIIRVSICPELPDILCHELFHAIELEIQNATDELERWTKTNPSGFDYTGSYAAWAAGEYADSEYLDSFADDYCFISPREDRAQTFLYAMHADEAARFESDAMQEKLEILSEAIRETFAELKDSEEVFPWEQHLN